MGEQVPRVNTIHVARRSQIALRIKIQLIFTRSKGPDSDVKFAILVEQGSLNVLLNYVLGACFGRVYEFLKTLQRLEHLNSSPLICIRWFDHPKIFTAMLLRHFLFGKLTSLNLLKSLEKFSHLRIVALDDESGRSYIEFRQ